MIGGFLRLYELRWLVVLTGQVVAERLQNAVRNQLLRNLDRSGSKLDDWRPNIQEGDHEDCAQVHCSSFRIGIQRQFGRRCDRGRQYSSPRQEFVVLRHVGC